MKLPDSPDDDRARNEALKRIGLRTAAAAVPIFLVALLAYGLGLPWWIVAVAVFGALYLVLFET